MKYIVILGDGMADYPVPELDGKTPLELAHKPNIDRLAERGELGLVKTVPDHLNPPGSDIANMSVLGYNPDEYYTGRSPLEAVSMGLSLSDNDLAIRCNIVNLSEEEPYEEKTMVDYSSDEISTDEARELVSFLNRELGSEQLSFNPGISYRHCIILKGKADAKLGCTPPHDISDRKITEYLPKGYMHEEFISLMKRSYELLNHHPINEARRAKGLRPANSIWPWGEGKKPRLSDFQKKYGLKGAIVSAVDLVRGLGLCAGMENIIVPNVTGTYKTNFTGKADAALNFLLNEGDFVYIHMEAPDECGHRHEVDNKILSIELIDRLVVGPIADCLKKADIPFKMLIMPDHPTPLVLRTHTHDAVPYLIYNSTKDCPAFPGRHYDEKSATAAGTFEGPGYKLMRHFIDD